MLAAPASLRGEAPAAECAALDPAAVGAVQQSDVVATASRVRRDGERVTVTCYLRTADPGRSVSFELVTAAAESPRAAAERWEELFREAEGDAERERESSRLRGGGLGAEATELPGTLDVPGLGEDARFVGTAAWGALYVLRGPDYFRLSVGGPGGLDAKLARSRSLAEKVLERLAAARPADLRPPAGDPDTHESATENRGAR